MLISPAPRPLAHHATLREARRTPRALDNAAIERTKRVNGEGLVWGGRAARGGHAAAGQRDVRGATQISRAATSKPSSSAEIVPRKGLDHPNLWEFVDDTEGLAVEENVNEHKLFVPGDIDPTRGSEIEEAIWDTVPFASRMRAQPLVEFALGTQLHRSESLAIVQVLILYHLAIARAAVAFD